MNEKKDLKERIKYRGSFYHPTRQAPLFMMVKEYWVGNEVVYADVIFSFWNWFPSIKGLITGKYPK